MPAYTHRRKPDGSWESICMLCYRTSAKSMTEPELRETEEMHPCEGTPQSLIIECELTVPPKQKGSDQF
jgi:hypothetical protein